MGILLYLFMLLVISNIGFDELSLFRDTTLRIQSINEPLAKEILKINKTVVMSERDRELIDTIKRFDLGIKIKETSMFEDVTGILMHPNKFGWRVIWFWNTEETWDYISNTIFTGHPQRRNNFDFSTHPLI